MANANFSVEDAFFVKETDATWVFQIPNVASINIEDNETPSNQSKEREITSKLDESLVNELVISKINPHFLSLHVYAKKPFKPSSLAKVNTFEVRLEYAEVWENGPQYIKFASRKLEGKYGFFININQFTTTTHTNIVVQALSEN